MFSKDFTEHRFVFRLKEMDAKAKDRLFFKMTQGSELVEGDEALFYYCKNAFRHLVLAELSDRFIVELDRNEEKGLHLIEFFLEKSTEVSTEGSPEPLRFWIKPADCFLETPVEGLPHFQLKRSRLRGERKTLLKATTIYHSSIMPRNC